MRYLLVSASVALMMSSSASAQIYPWCGNYGIDSAKNCGFATYELCMENRRGIGGHCESNPFYNGPGSAPGADRAARTSRKRGSKE